MARSDSRIGRRQMVREFNGSCGRAASRRSGPRTGGEKRMTRWLSIALFLFMASVAAAMEDTPENREQQVDRYMQAVPPQPMFEDLMNKMFKHLPADHRNTLAGDMKNFDFDALNKLTRSAMLKTFTADELAALADFHGSPIGRSATSKMGDYMAALMADFMPLMEAEIAKITAEIEKAEADHKKRLEELEQQKK